ncbi:uncharacterized protein LOC128501813 [Spea bombifrons]|uniref:uncharacterized protein LOC128501813 n=1 Tax=Spea bombifrons TaxID=233779 RepID=UPI00234A3292|nr:uncharacterized protein LOC128501813 [Spea bombifrons]
MENTLQLLVMHLVIGLLVFSSAANACNISAINETEACQSAGGINMMDLCKPTFNVYACAKSSELSSLPDDFLVTLSGCYNNETIMALDPAYAALLFSKLDANKAKVVVSSLNAQMAKLNPRWSSFLMTGAQSLVLKALDSNSSSNWTQPFTQSLQPLLAMANETIFKCLQSQNATCGRFQRLVRGVSLEFNNMPVSRRQELYPAIKSFLINWKNVTGSACAANVNSSVWLVENFGSFSQLGDINEFTALNANFSVVEVLPILSIPQLVKITIESDALNNSAMHGLILHTLQDKNGVYNFLVNLNAVVDAQNKTLPSPALSQALLNKTIQVFISNITTFNSTEWSQFFQNQTAFILPAITLEQLALVPPNSSCNFFQNVIKGLGSQYSNMKPDNRAHLYKSFIKPRLSKENCAINATTSTWINLNLGNFSQLASYQDLASLNPNFNALEALSVLTLPQVASFSVASASLNSTASSLIVGKLQNKTDVYNFLSDLNAAVAANNMSSVSPALSQTLFNKTLQVLGSDIDSFNSTEWSHLFQVQLSSVLPEITEGQLNLIPKNISCNSYQAILKTMEVNRPQIKNQGVVYTSLIKPYLAQKGNIITCYNSSDVNASAWFVNNMGSFFTYTNEQDLSLFANASEQQLFANNPSFVQLASQLTFRKDTAFYYTSLLTSSPNFNLSSIPDKFLCYLNPAALKKLNSKDALKVTKIINKECRNVPPGQVVSAPSAEDLQVAVSLVSKLDDFSSQTINELNQSAVGLSPSQINKISDKDLKDSLPTLSKVSGWTNGQSRSIVNKLLQANFQIKELESLGSLVNGLPSQKLQSLDSQIIVNALKDPQFVTQISSAPPVLKSVFAKQIVAANSNTASLVKNVPASLASYIPKSSLVFKSEAPVLQDLYEKAWTSDQAAMFFDKVVASETNFTKISPSVLQGFSCSIPKLNETQIKSLAKAMKTQNAPLGEDQLSCLTRQVMKNVTQSDLDTYPKEVLMFISPKNYSGTCKNYFTNVGMANISILQKDSKIRTNLLAESLSCMNVTNATLTDETVTVLGQLVCDLNATYIENCSDALLVQLSKCKSFSAEQEKAIQAVLLKGNSTFGPPSKWSKTILKNLGSLNGILNKDILTKIPNGDFTSWMKEAVETSSLSRNQFSAIVKNLKTGARTARSTAACEAGKQITADNIKDPLLPLYYTAAQLEACLNYTLLADFLPDLSSKPFTEEQLQVLKNKLDQLYPGGYPESVIPDLDAIAFLCGEADIKKWNITSVDTLSRLLATGPANTLATLYIGKYVDSAKNISSGALEAIGSKYVCLLSSSQLNLITPEAIRGSQALDISACNQTTKDALYVTAKAAYANMTDNAAIYYGLIKPYLGGAPPADLKALALKSVNMDIGTFIKLKPSSIMNLTVDDVKGLLGSNVEDLKNQETNTVVNAWIRAQKQSDLDRLGLGLTGGVRESLTTQSVTIKTSKSIHLFMYTIWVA